MGMRLTGPRLILQTLNRQAQETLGLVLKEAGGDLRQAWALWEAVKDQRASRTFTSQSGGPMKEQSNSKTKPRYLSLMDCANLPPESTEPYTSSPWEFDQKNLTLNLHDTSSTGTKRLAYYVDLEECATSAQVLDWIMHISEKTWATNNVLAGLVRDLRLYLGPEICFEAAQRERVNIKAIVRKRIPWANALRGRPTHQATE